QGLGRVGVLRGRSCHDKSALLPHLLTLWLAKLLMQICMRSKNVRTSCLFWPFEVPRLGILMVASPLHELALELHSTVYIAGESIGATLLLWDLIRSRRRQSEQLRRPRPCARSPMISAGPSARFG